MQKDGRLKFDHPFPNELLQYLKYPPLVRTRPCNVFKIAKRFWRNAGSSAFTITLSKKLSTGARKFANLSNTAV